MWTCPLCGQQFLKNNQSHSCNDKTLDEFLKGKSENTISLFWHLVQEFQSVGKITIYPTKSMIAIAAKPRIAFITRLGKNFVDVTFPFDQPHKDNLCFHKIAQVPGQQQYNHHFRIMNKEDINNEVLGFMRMAYKKSI